MVNQSLDRAFVNSAAVKLKLATGSRGRTANDKGSIVHSFFFRRFRHCCQNFALKQPNPRDSPPALDDASIHRPARQCRQKPTPTRLPLFLHPKNSPFQVRGPFMPFASGPKISTSGPGVSPRAPS
ncbi:hypothetical protein BKA80DRAFT_299590 [Phyllosticta citrichinensis]